MTARRLGTAGPRPAVGPTPPAPPAPSDPEPPSARWLHDATSRPLAVEGGVWWYERGSA